MRPLDLLSMAAVGLALSWCVFDLAARASDPYDIHSRQSPAFPASFAGSIATRDQEQEVKPAPGRIRPPMAGRSSQHIVTREKRDGHSRAAKIGQWVKVEISTYSRSYHGNGTHGGERYDHYRGHTAATTIIGRRWVLPNGSTWEVEYLGKTITVRINDTGSWRPKKAPYWLDLSGQAWRDLTGIAPSRKVARMRRVR